MGKAKKFLSQEDIKETFKIFKEQYEMEYDIRAIYNKNNEITEIVIETKNDTKRLLISARLNLEKKRIYTGFVGIDARLNDALWVLTLNLGWYNE